MKLLRYGKSRDFWQLYLREDYFRQLEGLPTRKELRRLRRKYFIRNLARILPLVALMFLTPVDRTYICTTTYFTPSGVIEIYNLKTTEDILKFEYFNNCKCDEI